MPAATSASAAVAAFAGVDAGQAGGLPELSPAAEDGEGAGQLGRLRW
jgi:hypothetical protein